MFEIIRIPAFKDNYIWLLRKGMSAVVVDPGDARPVLEAVDREGLTLEAILITHHHADHQGGAAELAARYPVRVYGPGAESITALTHPLHGGELVSCGGLGGSFQVLGVPGHTSGHLAYLGEGCLFCGDALFGGGCGRIFEGTPAQMFESLARLSALPDETRIYCAHEYTESNLRFAMAVEPGNRRLRDRVDEVAVLRAKGQATLPSTVALEKMTNPFLRCSVPEVVASARARGAQKDDPVAVFAALRQWKDNF